MPLLCGMFSQFRNESEFIQKLVKEKIITAAKALNLAFKYIDDVQSINN